MTMLPPIRLTGATILRDGEMQDRSIAVADGSITVGPLPEVNLSGFLILPGIVDLHGDAFERHVSPRPTVRFPLREGLRATDRDAAANGVTTAWLAQCWSWEGGMRGPDFAEALLAALDVYRAEALTDLHVQIRCETHMSDSRDRLIAAVARHRVNYVVFNNHLPEAMEMWKNAPEMIAGWAGREGRTAEEHMRIVLAAAKREPEIDAHLCALADAFDQLGVAYGSHDDPDEETRDRFRMIGAHIAEFPTHESAAAAAKACNDPVVMGAPNVVRGGSQAGGVSATALIETRLCDALVSDYHYPSLAAAAWTLVDRGIRTLPDAWAMISSAPADIMGMADRGALEPGRRADLVVVNEATRGIEATITGGCVSHLTGEAARRFLVGEARPLATV